nr:MAG TPA: deoxyribosyltransferase [Caudoviricetes sp.]
MNNQDKAAEVIKRLAQVAYLTDGEDISDKVEGKKVYLSGPITGKKNYKGLFLYVEELIKLCDVFRIFNPASQIPDSLNYEEAMKRCVAALAEYEAIVMLPGWHASKGARLEHDIALSCGMDVIDLTNYRLVQCSWNTLDIALSRLL